MRNITIHSAHLHKEIFLKGKVTEVFPGKGNQDLSLSSNIPVHPDLKMALHKLIPHVIELADLWGSDGQRVDEKHIKVLGFTIDKDGVTISATRELDNAKLVAIETPFQAWDDQIAPYQHAGELSEAIEECQAEVYEYVVNKKSQHPNQGSLFPADGESAPAGDDQNKDGDQDGNQDTGGPGPDGSRRSQDEAI